jgi:hypothetical protein
MLCIVEYFDLTDGIASVKLFMAGPGRFDLKHLILWRKNCFLNSILAAGKRLLVDCMTCLMRDMWSGLLHMTTCFLMCQCQNMTYKDRLWRTFTL